MEEIGVSNRRFELFFSWQTDLSTRNGRNFIGHALEKAARQVTQESEYALEIREAARGEPGAPAIAQTIFDRIQDADCLVADVSIINAPVATGAANVRETRETFGSRLESLLTRRVSRAISHHSSTARVTRTLRPTPNPNVLVEVGFAARSIGWSRVVLVHNLETGPIESLPFDIRGRYTVPFTVGSESERAGRKRELQQRLAIALRGVVQHGRRSRGLSWISHGQRAFLVEFAMMDLDWFPRVLESNAAGLSGPGNNFGVCPYELPTRGLHRFLEVALHELDYEDAMFLHLFVRDADTMNVMFNRLPVGDSGPAIMPTLEATRASVAGIQRTYPRARAVVEYAQTQGRPELGERLPRCPGERPYTLPSEQTSETEEP